MSKLTDDLRNKATAGWQKASGAIKGLRGAPPVVAPEAVSGGISNAERAAATPKGYATGGLATPQSKAVRVAKGLGTKVLAPLAAASTIGDSMAEDSTSRYAKRFGVSEPTGDGSVGDVLKFAGLRAGGFASDLGNTLTGGLAGKLYRDQPNEQEAVTSTAPVAPVMQQPSPVAPAPAPQARGLRSLDTDGEIIGTSTRADGRLNSFAGGSDRVNPEDFAAATQRAAADKARLVGLAAAKMSEGDLDGAYRLAAGDPEATAAVERARQQRGLRIRSDNGDKEASELLQQESANEAALAGKRIDADAAMGAASLKGQADLRLGLAKAQNDALKAQNDAAKDQRTQQNTERSFRNAEGKQNQAEMQTALEGVLGARMLKDGVPNPAYAEFESKVNETLLQEAIKEQKAAEKEGRAPRPTRTMADLHPTDLQDYLRKYDMYKKAQPNALGRAVNFITGNDAPESNDLNKLAPRKGSGKEGVLYDTYEDGLGRVRRRGGLAGDDLTFEERARVGLK